MPYNGDQKEIQRRLRELYRLLQEKHTLEELSQKTGRPARDIYRDIAKLGVQGCVIGSRLGTYWIEN